MNYFYIILIVLSLIGVFTQQKFIDIIFVFKIMVVAIIAHLWEENLITDSQAYVAFIMLYGLFMLLIAIKLPKEINHEEEIDRV